MLKVISVYMLVVHLIYGYINIYPSFFYKPLTKDGAFETFVLTNRSSSKVRYRIYFEKSSSQYLYAEVYPKSIVLKPYEHKQVKILITPRKKLKSGMYERVMVVKEIEVARAKSKRIYSMLRLKLLTYYGDLKLKLEGDIRKTSNSVAVDIINKGQRVGVFTAYLLNDKREWEYLDSIILKINERWEKIYKLDKNYKKIKIEEQDGKNYFLKNL